MKKIEYKVGMQLRLRYNGRIYLGIVYDTCYPDPDEHYYCLGCVCIESEDQSHIGGTTHLSLDVPGIEILQESLFKRLLRVIRGAL